MAKGFPPLHIKLLGSTSLLTLFIAATAANANPTGGVVEAGSATISANDTSTLSITQQSDKAIINWQSFNIGTGETTRFVLPNANSVTLNRDFSGDPSVILGNLQSNGQLYLVNRNGILFGANAQVDAAGLVATTHDIRSEDFLAGNLKFDIAGSPNASVTNLGHISIDDYGIGAFVAPHVRNDGAIVAKMGKVGLASANGFTLDLHGDSLISFLIENPNDVDFYDSNGKPISALVENSGSITADGGQVALTAKAARGVIDSVINTDGIIQANTVAQRGGKIILGGGAAGTVKVAGKISARGEKAGEKGGKIVVTGATLTAEQNAILDASGWAGGGKLMFGGDYLGGNATNSQVAGYRFTMEDEAIQTARVSVLANGAQLSADAIVEGNGGKVVVWADEATISAADISATGGALSGDGGFIETSGKYLQVEKSADASATNGEMGTWLLDPLDITIDTLSRANAFWSSQIGTFNLHSGGSYQAATVFPTASGSVVPVNVIEAGLNAGVNIVITTFGTSGSGSGDIRLKADIRKSSGGDARLVLLADDDVIIDTGVDIVSRSGRLDVELSAPTGDISARNIGRIDTNGGVLFLVFKDGINLSSASDMPKELEVLIANGSLGSNRRRVHIAFGTDRLKFDYSGQVADFYPGAISLQDSSTPNVYVFVGFENLVDAHLYDRSLVGDSQRKWRVGNAAASTINFNALNGIPEIEGFRDVRWSMGREPGQGFTPVIEVSLLQDATTDRYIVTAPSGQVALNAYLASRKPQSPVQQVVQQVENAALNPNINLQAAMAGVNQLPGLSCQLGAAQCAVVSSFGPSEQTLSEQLYLMSFPLAEQIRIRSKFDSNFQPSSGANLIILAHSFTDSELSIDDKLKQIDSILEQLASDVGLNSDQLRLFSDGRNANQSHDFEYNDLFKEAGWKPSPKNQSVFHSIEMDGDDVEKWTNVDGSEYIFVKTGDGKRLVDDRLNTGTFNYGVEAESPEHIFLDILPWVKWGTGPDDKGSAEARLQLLLDSKWFMRVILNVQSIDGSMMATGLPPQFRQ